MDLNPCFNLLYLFSLMLKLSPLWTSRGLFKLAPEAFDIRIELPNSFLVALIEPIHSNFCLPVVFAERTVGNRDRTWALCLLRQKLFMGNVHTLPSFLACSVSVFVSLCLCLCLCLSLCMCVCVCVCVLPALEPRSSYVLGKHSTTVLHPSPYFSLTQDLTKLSRLVSDSLTI